MVKNQPEQEFFSVSEVANKLGLDKKTVYTIVKEGNLDSYKFSSSIRIKKKDLEKYIEDSKTNFPRS